MSTTTDNDIKIVTGEIVQISASMSQSDVQNSNIGKMYPFIMLKTENGEVLKINNLVVDAHVGQHLDIGRTVTLYLKQIRHMTNFKVMNFAVAATSDLGTGIMDLPARVVRAIYTQAIFVGLILGAIASALLTSVIGGIFYHIGSTLGAITGLSFLEGLTFVGGAIGFLSGPALLIYLLGSAGRFAGVRRAAEKLRHKLTDQYHGATVRNM